MKRQWEMKRRWEREREWNREKDDEEFCGNRDFDVAAFEGSKKNPRCFSY